MRKIVLTGRHLSQFAGDTPYSNAHAALDYWLQEPGTLGPSGYARRWGWSRTKASRFIAGLADLDAPQEAGRPRTDKREDAKGCRFDGERFVVERGLVERWESIFPDVDLSTEIPRLAEWWIANPGKRRNRKVRTFLSRCLGRKQREAERRNRRKTVDAASNGGAGAEAQFSDDDAHDIPDLDMNHIMQMEARLDD